MPAGQFRIALGRAASSDYLSTVGIRILRGRTFTDHDGMGSDDQHLRTSAVVISESMAREFWPNEDPIGKRIYYGDENSLRFDVLGICGDVVFSLDDRPRSTMYHPILDGNWTDFYVVTETASAPESMVSAVRAQSTIRIQICRSLTSPPWKKTSWRRRLHIKSSRLWSLEALRS
jgi:putative ABC transport system permease protein